MANIRRSRAGGFIRGGRSRRETLWIGVDPAVVGLTVGGGTLTHALNASALALRPFTITRSRMTIQWSSDQTAATERQFGAYGLAVVSDEALAIGVTAVPTPVTDSSSDLWLLHQWLMSQFIVTSAIGSESVYQQIDIDSKAMRKVEDGQDIAFVGELATGVSDGFTLLVAGRLLVKLH